MLSLPATTCWVLMSNIAHRLGRLTAPGGLQNQMLSSVQASDSQNSVPVVCWPVSLLIEPGTTGWAGQIRYEPVYPAGAESLTWTSIQKLSVPEPSKGGPVVT